MKLRYSMQLTIFLIAAGLFAADLQPLAMKPPGTTEMLQAELALALWSVSLLAQTPVISLGTAAIPAVAPSPWVAFPAVSASTGDCLILRSAAISSTNRASWKGMPFHVAPISGGIYDATILYLSVAQAGTGDVVIETDPSSRAVVGLSKSNFGAAGCSLDKASFSNVAGLGSTAMDAPATTSAAPELFVGALAVHYDLRYFAPGTSQQGWGFGQIAANRDNSLVLVELNKIATAAEASQLQVTDMTFSDWMAVHVTFRRAVTTLNCSWVCQP